MLRVERTMRRGETCRRRFVTTMRGRAMRRRGTVPTTYLVQKRVRGSRGDERRSQVIRPSRDMAGKMKRAATAATTNPASPRFRNPTRCTRKKEISSVRPTGSTRML
jgi:hypothetical protein